MRGLDGEDGGGNSTSLDGKNVPVASGKTTYEAVSSEEREESADASGKAFLIRCCLIWVECRAEVAISESRNREVASVDGFQEIEIVRRKGTESTVPTLFMAY